MTATRMFWSVRTLATLLAAALWPMACSEPMQRRQDTAETRKHAREFLEFASKTAKAIEDPESAVHAYSAIAWVRAKDGDTEIAEGLFESAKRSAGRISRPQRRARSQLTIAYAQVAAGDLAGAERTAEGIGEPEPRGYAYLAIAAAMANAGDVDAAEEIIARIREPKSKTQAYLSVAESQARTGDLENARRLFGVAKVVADTIEPPGLRAAVYVNMVGVLAKAGEFGEAKTLAGAIAEPEKKCLAYAALGVARLEAGQAALAVDCLKTAQTVARSINDAQSKATACRVLAQAQARAGQLQRAKSTADLIDDPKRKAWAYSGIAAARARAADFTAAKATADQIRDFEVRSYAYLVIAEARAQAGDTDGIQELLRAARLASAGARASGSLSMLDAAIAKVQAQAGDFEAAGVTVGNIVDLELKVMALLSIAKAHAGRSDCESAGKLFGAARSVADRIDDPKVKSSALRAVVETLSKSAEELIFPRARTTSRSRPVTGTE